MGAWSSKPFGNDTALDTALDLEAASSPSEFSARLVNALRSYEEYDKRRDRGENFKIWTEEYVEWMLGQIQPPIDPDIEEILRDGIGEEQLDTGSDPAYEAIAAGTIMLAACRNETAALKKDVRTPLLDTYRPIQRDISEAVRILNLIPKNVELCRDCGSRWKKNVIKLAEELRSTGCGKTEKRDGGN